MAEQKESSVLFSLKELQNLEDERTKQEEDDRQRSALAEQQARLDDQRRALEAEEGRRRAEEERRRVEDQRLREEQARVDAIRHAEVERARLDAENAARMEAMRRQQEHEAQLVRIKEGSGKKKAMLIAGGVAGLLLIGAVGAGVAFKINNDKATAIQAAKDQEIAQKQAQLDKLMSDLKAQSDQVEQLNSAVANAKSDADRVAAQQRLADAQKAQQATQAQVANIRRTGGGGGGGGGGATKPRPACTCQAGDPLCSCL
jgi:colicin import membrane protein